MKESKKYWKGIEELTNDVEFVKNADKEFPEYLPINNKSNGEDGSVEGMLTHRRDFLKLLGFGMAAVSLAACEAPVKKAIPYLNKPEEIDPGIANYYATTYVDGGDYCSILVKTREGRPIKVEGNNLSSVTRGGTSPRVQASVLSLYDTERFKGPQIAGKAALWDEVDKQITAKLAQAAGKGIRIVSPTIISPTTKQIIAEFKNRYPSTVHVMYDAVSSSGMLNANQQSFGVFAIPSYDFSIAETIVSFGADFLGTWVSPIEFARQFGQNRKLGKNKKTMSRLYVFESNLSLTGANADYRWPVRPSEEGLYVTALYNALAKQTGGTTVQATAPKDTTQVELAAKDLLANRGKSVVVSGSNDVNVQVMVNAINNLLGNYGSTIDLSTPMFTRQGDDASMVSFVNDVKAGNVGAVIFYGANPVYDYVLGKDLENSLKKVPLKISLADRPDETSVLCDYICPDLHYLEAWGDAEPKKGYYSLIQPTISPIFQGRLAQESFLVWAGKPQDYYSYLQNSWRNTIYPQQKQFANFQEFWNRSLHDGVFEAQGTRVSTDTIIPGTSTMEGKNVGEVASMNRGYAPSFNANLSNAATYIAQKYKPNASGIDLVIYQKIGVGNGSQANNPWLQEFPDPISKATWDNYVAMPKALAKSLDIKQDDIVSVQVKGKEPIELPALIQPGQAPDSIAIAIGYGRSVTGKTAKDVGKNAYPLISATNTGLMYSANDVQLAKASGTRKIAQTQTHETIMARPVVQEARLSEYQKDPAAGREMVTIQTAEGPVKPTDLSLWNIHKYPNHAWGMVIDLNSCIGCGACVIGCQAENNVPVVGREEVINRREMHWLRIDRYYSSPAEKGDYRGLEEAAENPEVVFQPMLCQQCNNAPCETVCPVAATTHSTEGLNQMAYNRCVGTRYCANNCPYKVRRFNWFSYPQNDKFDFHMNNDLGRMVLNPDVTVRARGVMEKCTFCVQRIQAGKLEAKKERRRPQDGEILTACAQACPTQAISFGDMNDPNSVVSVILNEEYNKRAFHVLEEINTRPNVAYLTKIRNKA